MFSSLSWKKRSFKGADFLLQLTLSLCRIQSVKTPRIQWISCQQNIAIQQSIALIFFPCQREGLSYWSLPCYRLGDEDTLQHFFTVVAVSWCNPGLFPTGQTRADKKRPALSWASDSKENSAERRALERWVNTKASGCSGFKQKSTAFNLL